MTAPSVVDQIRKSSALGGLGFGAVAVLVPRLFLGVYGLPHDASLRTMTRLWGTRTAVIGALLLAAEGAETQRKVMMLGTAMNTADAAIVATGGRGLPARARVLGTLTSGSFAAAGAYALMNSR